MIMLDNAEDIGLAAEQLWASSKQVTHHYVKSIFHCEHSESSRFNLLIPFLQIRD